MKAALEWAANTLFMFSEPYVKLEYGLEDEMETIRAAASDPDTIAAIIKTAGGKKDE